MMTAQVLNRPREEKGKPTSIIGIEESCCSALLLALLWLCEHYFICKLESQLTIHKGKTDWQILRTTSVGTLRISHWHNTNTRKSMNSTILENGPSFVERLIQGPDALEPFDLIVLGIVIMGALELLNFAAHSFGDWLGLARIPVRGKHLDDFSSQDYLFIGFSKLSLPPFVYFYLRYAFYCDSVPWHPAQLSVINTLLALVLLFVVYDFFYTLLHGFLHVKGVYALVHKHHHHQKAPSRANTDAINVHPLEFFLGEYNHLWALYLTSTFIVPVHIVTAIIFLGIGGFLAGLNHTRHDVVLRLGGWTIFDSKAHDVHHRIPQSNYGQYTMFWDHIFGFYR